MGSRAAPSWAAFTQLIKSGAFRESSSEAKQDSVLTTPANQPARANARPTRCRPGPMLGITTPAEGRRLRSSQ